MRVFDDSIWLRQMIIISEITIPGHHIVKNRYNSKLPTIQIFFWSNWSQAELQMSLNLTDNLSTCQLANCLAICSSQQKTNLVFSLKWALLPARYEANFDQYLIMLKGKMLQFVCLFHTLDMNYAVPVGRWNRSFRPKSGRNLHI